MSRIAKRSSAQIGLRPGALVYTGEKKSETIKITLIDYDETQFQEKEIRTVEECLPFKDSSTVTWVNIDGIHQIEIIEKIGNLFNIHPLVLEDIASIDQRPKMEDLGDYIFVVLKMLYLGEKNIEIKDEQVSLVLASKFVISFQESEGDVFNSVRERIRTGKGRIRKMGTDYLCHALIDAVVDNYFVILENFGEKISSLEEELLTNPTPKTMHAIHSLKKEIVFLRKFVWPLREVINGLERGESKLIKKTTTIYLKDLYDHTIQVIDTIETFRDMVSGILDIYLSSISNRMNEVMKVLTIIATIFIPLTFIAGVYGMNFKYMPELEFRFGYYIIWSVMIFLAVTMLIYFKKRKWL